MAETTLPLALQQDKRLQTPMLLAEARTGSVLHFNTVAQDLFPGIKREQSIHELLVLASDDGDDLLSRGEMADFRRVLVKDSDLVVAATVAPTTFEGRTCVLLLFAMLETGGQ